MRSGLRTQLEDVFRDQAKLKPTEFRAAMDDLAEHAALAQLVTPVSGAVVLENQRQYDENDLEPADPDSVPNVPEPAYAALAITLLICAPLLWRRWAMRRASS
ncbi:MAG: hypothetical protein ACQKBV_10385 [Puniceicoccales bacterium]